MLRATQCLVDADFVLIVLAGDGLTGRARRARRTVAYAVGCHVAAVVTGGSAAAQLLALVQKVHERHVAEGGLLALSDETLESRVPRQDGRLAVGRERERAVVHDGAEIVRYAVVFGLVHLDEVAPGLIVDVAPQDGDVVVTVDARTVRGRGRASVRSRG